MRVLHRFWVNHINKLQAFARAIFRCGATLKRVSRAIVWKFLSCQRLRS